MPRAVLRILTIVFIILDCIGTFVPGTPVYFKWLGRLAAPILLYCMAWNMDKVRNRNRYLLCLYGCSVAMALLNFLPTSVFLSAYTAVSTNLFATAFASGCMIELYLYQVKYPEKKALIWEIYAAWQLGGVLIWCILSEILMVPTNVLQLIFTILGNLFLAEGSFLMVFLGFLLYRTKEKRSAMALSYGLIFLIYFLNASTGIFGKILSFLPLLGSDIAMVVAELLTGLSMYGTWVAANFSLDHLLYYDYQWMMIAALPLLLLGKVDYAARRRKSSMEKSAYLLGLYPLSVYLFWFLGNFVF